MKRFQAVYQVMKKRGIQLAHIIPKDQNANAVEFSEKLPNGKR